MRTIGHAVTSLFVAVITYGPGADSPVAPSQAETRDLILAACQRA